MTDNSERSTPQTPETLADWERFPVRGDDILRPSEHKSWRLEPYIKRGRPYDGAIIDKKGRLIIPRTHHD